MSRKDTIIIAVLVNAGLLAILFATAWHGDEDKVIDKPEATQVMSQAATANKEVSAPGTASTGAPKDEIDQVLQRYTAAQQAQASGVPVTSGAEVNPVQSEVTVSTPASGAGTAAAAAPAPDFVEVTVKRGDVLAKIARANGTTVEKIMKANNMQNTNLSIGQVLKIPKAVVANTEVSAPKPDAKAVSADVQYYTVASGDNPWSIARKFQIPLDELLKMNKLNNETARNLKIGDKLRVK